MLQSSTEQQIKRRYKDLSRVYHPDKAHPDQSKNQTVEDINDYWVELSKAYKALTDEDVRNNFIQYGHPDGKQSFSIGIALPKFIVTEGNGKYVLLVYGALLGVLLPYIVGKWWYGTQRMTKEGVLIASAGNLFKEYKEDIAEGGVVTALSCGEEYKDILSGNKIDSGLGKIEKALAEDSSTGEVVAGPAVEDRKALEIQEGVRRKVLALLWAYLARIRLDGSKLDDGVYTRVVRPTNLINGFAEKYEIAPQALALNESFTAIALAFGNVPAVLATYHTSQRLIQAIPPGSSPLLQLPHITPSIAAAIEGPGSLTHLTVQEFMAMPEFKRRKLATDQPNVLTPSQYNTAMSVARQIPLLKIEKAFFKVLGERHITTSSLVQFVIKARIIPPGTMNIPEVNELDLEDVDPDEGDLDALLGRRSKKANKAKQLDSGSDDSSALTSTDGVEKPLQPPLAFAPYFARDHSPRWHVFLTDNKLGKIAVPPFMLTTFNKPLFTAKGEPTFNMQTFKMQFQAPPQAASYPFVAHVICDSYIGMDLREEVTLVVEDAAKAEEVESEDDISEPDEGEFLSSLGEFLRSVVVLSFPLLTCFSFPQKDSLAAQMSALKSGQPLSPSITKRRPKNAKKVGESSEDESDTEGEAGDDTSETDTVCFSSLSPGIVDLLLQSEGMC